MSPIRSVPITGVMLLCVCALMLGCASQGHAPVSILSVSPETVMVGSDDTFRVRFAGERGADIDLSRYLIAFEDAGDDFVAPGESESGLTYSVADEDGYVVEVSGTLSGLRQLEITDTYTGTVTSVPLSFLPGPPSGLEVLERRLPESASNELDRAAYILALVDRFGNVIPDAQYSASASFGSLTSTRLDDGARLIDVRVDGYGDNQISVRATAGDTVYEFDDTASFGPIQVAQRAAYAADGQPLQLPILAFVPQSACESLRSMDIELIVPPGVVVAEIALNTETFAGTITSKTDPLGSTTIDINGNFRDDIITQGGCKYPVGDLILEPIESGTYYRVAGGGYTLVTENEEAQEEICNEGVECEPVVVDITQTHLSIVYTPKPPDPTFGTGKSVKNICLDFIVAPIAERSAVISLGLLTRRTEEIFAENASNCHCPHFVRIESYRVHELTVAEWRTSFVRRGRTGWNKLPDVGKVKRWLDNPGDALYQRRGQCTPVFITDMPGTKKGRAVHQPPLDIDNAENYVVVDHVKGFENGARTLAHELGHIFGPGRVLDSPKPGAAAQGGRQRDNLYRYGRAGTNITPAQCAEFDFDHSRFNNPPQ